MLFQGGKSKKALHGDGQVREEPSTQALRREPTAYYQREGLPSNTRARCGGGGKDRQERRKARKESEIAHEEVLKGSEACRSVVEHSDAIWVGQFGNIVLD
ncbi:hypothetical protein V7S43_010700 [Phytophthora oleae]|uniref:Uncharacterized protein n=1 Tax=Phytophthora oleae TaxID=2107226 RepID=A0ABD3FD66_9STRA